MNILFLITVNKMNIKNKYKNIPGTIDISGKRTVITLDPRDIPFNTKKFIQII
jgi:hypothetical protein